MNLENGQADSVVPCTVITTCVNPSGKTIATQGFPFVVNGGAIWNMVEVMPSGFKGCWLVEFVTTSAGGNLIGTAVDTISYTVYSKLPLSPK